MPTDGSGTSPTHPRAPPERSSPTSSPRSTDPHASRSSANRCCECSGCSTGTCASCCPPTTSSMRRSSPSTLPSTRVRRTRHRLGRDHPHHHRVLPPHRTGASADSTTRAHRGALMNHKMTACLLIGAAVSTNVAFFALGRGVFNYPDVLDEPVAEILTGFRHAQGSVGGWFFVLACSAALLAPIAVGVGRLSSGRAMYVAVRVGIAAAVVQAIGLLRWPILVPGYAVDANSAAADAALACEASFTTANDVLGTVVERRSGTSSPPRGPCSSSSPSDAATPDDGSTPRSDLRRTDPHRCRLPLEVPLIDPPTSSATSCGAAG